MAFSVTWVNPSWRRALMAMERRGKEDIINEPGTASSGSSLELRNDRPDGRADLIGQVGGGEPVPPGVLLVEPDGPMRLAREIDDQDVIDFIAVWVDVEQLRAGEHAEEFQPVDLQAGLLTHFAPGCG